MDIIIQAGGIGSRLESLTWNKPKCLVSINGLPILFHTFQKFPDANFYIIADYKVDVLKRYLNIFAGNFKFRIIEAGGKGTASGIKKALKFIPKGNPIFLMWSDLIPSASFKLPEPDKNYIGISCGFECRWSFIDNELTKCVSSQDGVAGCFYFKNKTFLKNLPDSGEFVAWLKDQNIIFERMPLEEWKEIGTLLSYRENCRKNVCRPNNS